jgi:hypothetical protein
VFLNGSHACPVRSARLQAERREAIVAAVAVRRLYRVQRNQLAAAHSAMCVRLPAPQEWLPVEALPELVAELDTPGADDGQRQRSRRRVGN